ncbi:MAG: hypothetical protein RI926_1116 [Actinomycetota bacterium]|jgi:uncharacterized protein (DUF1778 family)
MRITPEALGELKAAAEVNNQDVSSFVLSSALSAARTVLIEERILRLSSQEILQLEKVLESEPEAIPALTNLFRKTSELQRSRN